MKSPLPILAATCLVVAASPLAFAQDVAPELPESALAEEALKDPIATESPNESGDIKDAAEELKNYSTAPAPGGNSPVGDEYSAFYHDAVDLESSTPASFSVPRLFATRRIPSELQISAPTRPSASCIPLPTARERKRQSAALLLSPKQHGRSRDHARL